MAAAATEAEMQEAVAAADSDLQYILQESGATLQTQYRVVQVHASRRRFQAVADTRAEARAAANRDFGIPNDTVEGRAQAAAIVAAWELAKEYTTKEVELKAEAKVLGHKRVVQVQERQAMLRAVTTMYGKLNEGETPSSEDNQVESLQSTVDASGHVRITKTMQKLDMPHNSEAYRRVMKVQSANFLVDNTLRLAAAAAQVGNAFLIEHPEDLGLAEDGSRPSSIWQWPDMLELIACHNSLSFAVFQCEYGADTSKPTRFVTNLSSFQKQPPPYAGSVFEGDMVHDSACFACS
eukprot:s9765_g1.t1